MTIDAPRNDQRPALWALWQEAFGDGSDFLARFESTAFSPDRCRCVTVDGRIGAALYWFDCALNGQPIAYLYAIATATALRGRGLCRALVWDTHEHLRARGYAGTVLVPGSRALFELYEKLGYRTCSSIGELCCSASADGTVLRQIELTEYADLRRTLLPKNSVIQEQENLTFLRTQATLYTGQGFLLAARRESDTLYGMELLGDPTAAPAIVRALGCKTGRFRVPGTDRPFAMYHPLRDGAPPPPAYFGLAFD